MTAHAFPSAPRRRTLPALLALGSLWAVAAAAQTEVSRRVPAAADGAVRVSNLAGSVVVRGWDRAEVEVTGTLHRDVDRLDVDSSAGRTEIEVVLPRHGRHSGAADLEVRVPAKSRVELELVSADAVVAGVAGAVLVETVSGSVEVEGRAATVEVETVSGSIEVRGESPRVSAESVSGSIDVDGVRGELEAASVSGSVTVRGESLGRVRIESVSGSLEVDGSLAPSADVSLESHSGGVDLLLPEGASARIEATTYSGRIRNDLGPSPEKVGRFSPESRLDFTLGSGSARVSLETFSGSIEIRGR